VSRSRDADPTHAAYLAARPPRYRGVSRTSRYLVMRDGVRIAIDVCLPRGLAPGERVPTIVRQTRYFRRFRVNPMLRRVLSGATLDPMNAPMRALFTSRGYAWVDVDARGSGASFGERPAPWYLEGEVADGAEIVDFIVKQPWSNGLVGSTGVSYEGTTAEFLGTLRHPAVRAVAPRFSLFDVFTDVAFPGGLHNAYFTDAWERANGALDRNEPGEMVGLIYALRARGTASPRVVEEGTLASRLASIVERPRTQRTMRALFDWALAGVAPVDDADGERVLAEALRSHADNYNVHTGAVHMTYRDDSPPNAPLPGKTSDAFSPHTYVDALRDVAVLSYGGWFDGGYGGAAVKRHRALSAHGRSSLLLGPWVHGGALDMDPDEPRRARDAAFDHATELLRFFDTHLAPSRTAEEQARVRYYMMGEGRWRTASAWPPPGTRSLALFLAADRKLGRAEGSGDDVFETDPRAGSGVRTRWRTLLCPFLHADGRGRHGRTIAYESDPFDAEIEIAGQPVLALCLASSAPDAAIFAYLEDVAPSGDARLLTEGCLRTLHATRLEGDRVVATFARKDALVLGSDEQHTHFVELLPVAMRLGRAHRLRLSLAGADVDHFTTPTGDTKVRWRIDRAASRLVVPVLP
jgi:putative CocE/NonD family hydrolase